MRSLIAFTLLTASSTFLHAAATAPSLGGCALLPADNVWHARADNLPVHPLSGAYVATFGASSPAHPDFGSDPGNGIPYNLVSGTVPSANVTVTWPFTSDSGPYPIPSNALVETPSDPTNPNDDHHLIVLNTNNCELYEAYGAIETSASTDSWDIMSISKFALKSDTLKPANWSSSNAAGTTYLPGLIRYDEVAAGHIDHAIAMTATGIGNTYVWPADRTASSLSGSQYPPMGTRFRLKANVDISGFDTNVRVVLEALKTYGAIVIDNGASWFMVGVPDARWNDDEMHAMTQLHGSDFEAVDESSLEVSSSSGQVASGPVPTGWVTIVNKMTGKCLEITTGLHSIYASEGVGGLRQAACTTGAKQKFQLVPVAGGWAPGSPNQWVSANGNGYMINNASTGVQISVPNGTTQNGAQLVEAGFTDNANWVWTPVSVGNGYFYIQSLSNSLVLEGGTGSIVEQWPSGAGDNQLWEFVPAS